MANQQLFAMLDDIEGTRAQGEFINQHGIVQLEACSWCSSARRATRVCRRLGERRRCGNCLESNKTCSLRLAPNLAEHAAEQLLTPQQQAEEQQSVVENLRAQLMTLQVSFWVIRKQVENTSQAKYDTGKQ